MAFTRTRIDESRAMLMAAAHFALGSYTEQEATKGDAWRDTELGALYAHLLHEVESEIKGNVRRGEMTFLIHNAADAVSLSLMLLARALEMSGAELPDKTPETELFSMEANE